MKFVHIADLHLGKVLHQYNMLEIQIDLLKKVLKTMKERDIHVLVLAGDIYDRLIPSQESVNALNDFLTEAILVHHFQVLMISGNHDSSDRLNFGSQILTQLGLHIATHCQKAMQYVDIEDCRFYLLPFMKPAHIKMVYPDTPTNTYQEALEYYLSFQNIDKNRKSILVTHQFVGKTSIVSDSELPLSVGGSDVIDASLFDAFDYVALGHLHASQKVSRETMRYSGSLTHYSFDEVKQKKSIVIIDTEDMRVECLSLKPIHEMHIYSGTFEQCNQKDFIAQKEDLIALELTDEQIVPQAYEHLKLLYPNLLQITYPTIMKKDTMDIQHIHDIDHMNMYDLYQDFYTTLTTHAMSEEEQDIVEKLMEGID